jgi:hypothetical protein
MYQETTIFPTSGTLHQNYCLVGSTKYITFRQQECDV